MTSGSASKKKRQLAKVPPVGGGSRKASPKVLLLAGAAIAVLIAVILGIVSLTGGRSSAEGSGTTELPGAAEVAQQFRGVPQSGTTLGNPDAPVTLVEYIDLQCPFCKQYTVEALPTLVEEYVRSGKLRIETRGLAFIGPESERGMRAAYAAAQQDKMFQFVDLLYKNQGAENGGWLDDDMIRAAVASIEGLDLARLLSDADSDATADQLAEDRARAEKDEVTGTPTILVGPTGGRLTKVELTSAADIASIKRAIADASGS